MKKQAYIDLGRGKYGDQFDYSLLPTTVPKRGPVDIICKTHGKFTVISRDHLRTKYGCPRCACESRGNVKTKDTIKACKLKFNDKFDYSQVSEKASQSDAVIIVCPRHGSLTTTLRKHLHSLTGCERCGREQRSETVRKYDSIETLSKLIDSKYTLSNFNIAKATVDFTCPEHGTVTRSVTSISEGRGCMPCFYDRLRITRSQFLRRAAKVHGKEYIYCIGELKTTNHWMTMKHLKCGIVSKVRVSNHLSGQSCMKCKVSSLAEVRIADFLKRNKIRYKEQFKIKGHLYRYDFFIPGINLLIEYDGEQHFRPVDFFGGLIAWEKTVERDKEKDHLAKSHGYNLIRISYKSFDTVEKTLSRAIDSKFKYRVNNKFYRNFIELCNALKLSPDTSVKDVEHYRSYNVLSACLDSNV
ncbi:MAG: hypothetical protein CMF37_15345 [Leeuwenhoekiella sp.]|nr:hypothetical protein [Leeuwenhoekiella sp.]MBH14287.1 hypothetical protein [Leeuwenhoekiella sp.]MBQ50206.1 hypothetical protein [Leeuwenhoekiella sp.]MBQ50403.1 hypothetical protein [Leeuwenhoekiella sp.]|tara:strand:- start:845 stop:2083 length:1239 start_codon:yes stop_codon:yes gene_type:complete